MSKITIQLAVDAEPGPGSTTAKQKKAILEAISEELDKVLATKPGAFAKPNYCKKTYTKRCDF